MTENSIGRFIRGFIFGCFTLSIAMQSSSMAMQSSTGEALKAKQIAGHRILKVYGEKNFVENVARPSVIFEDRSGLYWIGTYAGVNLYDEKRDKWHNFTKQTGQLISNAIRFIGQSSDNKLWFASGYAAIRKEPNLSCFDGESWHKFDATSEGIGLKYPITAMFPDRDGRLWFAARNELVAFDGRQWSPRLKLSEALGGDFPVSVRAGLQDSEGYIWLMTSEGIVRFDEHKQEWKILDLPPNNPNPKYQMMSSIIIRMMFTGGIYRVFEDRKGRIWCASLGGPIYLHMVYEKSSDSWFYYDLVEYLPKHLQANSDLGLTVMYEDKAGRMMFGTKIGLLTFVESENKWELFTPENSGLPDAKVASIFEDRSGRIWIGTGKGIVVLES